MLRLWTSHSNFVCRRDFLPAKGFTAGFAVGFRGGFYSAAGVQSIRFLLFLGICLLRFYIKIFILRIILLFFAFSLLFGFHLPPLSLGFNETQLWTFALSLLFGIFAFAALTAVLTKLCFLDFP